MAQKKVVWLTGIILCLIAVVAFVYFPFYFSSTKTYIGNVKECALLDYACGPGDMGFTDFRGCGCMPDPYACASSDMCEIRGKDEWEVCVQTNQPWDELTQQIASDAMSPTEEGYTCICIDETKSCGWWREE